MHASIVIPTRNRQASLDRCLEALSRQERGRWTAEVIVVDDGSDRPVHGLPDVLDGCTVLRAEGIGPAAARNRGIAAATGDVVLFTDDDVVPSESWVTAAVDFLEARDDCAGVEGPTRSDPFDYVYEDSLVNDRAGAYWTCNVAYRHSALEAVGGFSEQFPWPHGEDRDLAFRVLGHGPIGFAPAMSVDHTPRRTTVVGSIWRGRLAASDMVLRRNHPERFARASLPATLIGLLRSYAHHWIPRLRSDALLRTSPRRAARVAAVIVGHLAVAVAAVCWTAASLRFGKSR